MSATVGLVVMHEMIGRHQRLVHQRRRLDPTRAPPGGTFDPAAS
jgi:hypothetical protein